MEFVFGANKELYRELNPEKINKKKNDLQKIDVNIKKKHIFCLETSYCFKKKLLITIEIEMLEELTFRDQMIGPLQIPVADNAITLTNFWRNHWRSNVDRRKSLQ